MRVYKSKEELKAEINKTFDKYISEFDCIPETIFYKGIMPSETGFRFSSGL